MSAGEFEPLSLPVEGPVDPCRRREDRVGALLHAYRQDLAAEALRMGPPLDWKVYELPPDGEPQPRPIGRVADDVHSGALLLDLGGSHALLVAGPAIYRIPRGSSEQDLLARAAAGAAAWEREQTRLWRRARLPDQLADLSALLNTARTEDAIARHLTEYTTLIVGGYSAHLLIRREANRNRSAFGSRYVDAVDSRISVRSHPRFMAPGVITVEDARHDHGMPFSELAPLFEQTGAVVFIHVPVGDSGMLLLAERRRSRVVEPEDLTLMRNLAHLAEGALLRVSLVAEAHRLSLVDPLTGLANRRQLDLLMRHVWASARRGKPFALVLCDIDDFKEINDTRGHLVGDRILREIAQILREEVRGSDLVVRYGGDEFLIVLPEEGADGAATLVRRIHGRLTNGLQLSAGIAEFHPEFASFEELIEVADRQLYSVKRRKRLRQDFEG